MDEKGKVRQQDIPILDIKVKRPKNGHDLLKLLPTT